MDNWSEEWPQEPGYYWFYGWPEGYNGRDPWLYSALVRGGTGDTFAFFSTIGMTVFDRTNVLGVWQKAVIPTLPYIAVKELARERGWVSDRTDIRMSRQGE